MKINFVFLSLFLFCVITEAKAGISEGFTEDNALEYKVIVREEKKEVAVEEIKKEEPKIEKKVDVVEPALKEETNSSAEAQPEAKTQQNKEQEMSLLEKRRAELSIERSKETSRFKKRAIENTMRREKKHEEILKEKEKRESRFQKRAREDEKKRREEAKEREKNEVKTRFQLQAEKKAEARAKKKEEREKRLKRNKDK